MFDLPTLASFIVAAFIVTVVPGITVSAIVSMSLTRGLAAGLWMELGAQLGRLGMVILVAVALEAVSGAVAFAFDWIKFAGAAYLAWMGWGYLRSKHTVATEQTKGERTPLRQIASGFLVLWSNPKAFLFFGAFLPQFVNPDHPAWPQVLFLGAIEMLAALVTDGAYIVVAARARHLLTGDGIQRVNWIAGVMLIGAALWLAMQHHS